MKISKGLKENDIVIGNVYDKYNSRNPIIRWFVNRFDRALSDFIEKSAPNTIHEIGCGEGFWVLKWNKKGINAFGSDASSKIIRLAKNNAIEEGFSPEIFSVRDIYILSERDEADLIVCCEVLEHLQNPALGLQSLQRITKGHIILSVPREPIWRILNIMRGKYLKKLGNTPGHVQHWTYKSFLSLAQKYFDIISIRSPLPWTILLCKTKYQTF